MTGKNIKVPTNNCISFMIAQNIADLQIWPYLGASKCWGHCVLQTPVPVFIFALLLGSSANKRDSHDRKKDITCKFLLTPAFIS